MPRRQTTCLCVIVIHFQPRRRLPWPWSMSSDKKWYYIDDQGLQQGPFKPRKLQKWYRRGLLPSTLLLTHTPKDPHSFVSLLELTTSTVDQTFTTTAATTKSLPVPTTPSPSTSAVPLSLARPKLDSTRSLRAQILQLQFEISLARLHSDALHTVASSLQKENKHLADKDLDANLQLLVLLTTLNRPTE